MNNRFEKILEQFTYILEMIIAVLTAAGVLVGLVDVFRFFPRLLVHLDPNDTYSLFQSFLGYVLLLIVGVELILMILYRSNRAVLELILFVIARKMLIYAKTMLDLVLGVLALGIVYAIMHFLLQPVEKNIFISTFDQHRIFKAKKKKKEKESENTEGSE